MSWREREEAEPRKWRLEEEARSWAVGAEGGTDEMEWRRRRGAGLLVLEAENQNGDDRKLKWEMGKREM